VVRGLGKECPPPARHPSDCEESHVCFQADLGRCAGCADASWCTSCVSIDGRLDLHDLWFHPSGHPTWAPRRYRAGLGPHRLSGSHRLLARRRPLPDGRHVLRLHRQCGFGPILSHDRSGIVYTAFRPDAPLVVFGNGTPNPFTSVSGPSACP